MIKGWQDVQTAHIKFSRFPITVLRYAMRLGLAHQCSYEPLASPKLQRQQRIAGF